MKKGLPKFVLITDPYNSLEGRIIIFRTQFPKFIYELNRSEDADSRTINAFGKDYSIVIRKNLDNQDEIKLSDLNEAIRWFHFSKSELKKDI